jgi:hypothetical protein
MLGEGIGTYKLLIIDPGRARKITQTVKPV